ncbi:hypothetical protein KEM55_002892 [Ascosphaera atra]|nr:hypothetical protein KEM55_002892 [Ascosphaera atra]
MEGPSGNDLAVPAYDDPSLETTAHHPDLLDHEQQYASDSPSYNDSTMQYPPHPHHQHYSSRHQHQRLPSHLSGYSAEYSQASTSNYSLEDESGSQRDRRESGNSYDSQQSNTNSQAQYSSSPAISYQHPSHLQSQTQSAASSSRPPSSQLSDGTGERDRDRGDNRHEYLQAYQEPAPRPQPPPSRNSVVIKVGMVGDAQIGKTSLMVKYVEGSWDEDYIQTLGVNFMEKTISIRNTEITFSIWDLGGQREFVNMLPLVCNDAVAILFMFDLTRKSTLNSIKEWYRQGRGFNKTAIPFLVGTKYDHFVNFPREDQEEISIQAKRFAKAMRASLIFSSTSHSINVQKIFKIVLAKAFDLKCTIPEIENIGEPLLLYQNA